MFLLGLSGKVTRNILCSRHNLMAEVIDIHATHSLEGQRLGAVAQMGERCNRTAEVRGSNPLSSTKAFP